MIALVTGGESAKENWSYDKAAEYAAVVGVNWASHHYQTDWIVALDPAIWRIKGAIMPRQGLVSYATQPPDVTNILEAANLKLLPFGARIINRATGICSFTFPYALRFCLQNWPDDHIHVYGLDMDSTSGLFPFKQGQLYEDSRWNNKLRFIKDLFYQSGDRIEMIGCRLRPDRIRKGA